MTPLDAIAAPFTSSIDVPGIPDAGTGDVAGFSATATGEAAPFALSVLRPPTPPWSASGDGMDVDGGGAAATSLDGDGLTDVMAQLVPDARLVASAAVLTLASEAILGARILGPRGRPAYEGFDQATRDAKEAKDGFSDSRLMVQIGMALGVVHLAFLSV